MPTDPTTATVDRRMGFAILRLMLGINMLGRSIIRIPELQSFADGVASGFEDTIVPATFAYGFAYVIVIAETITGIMLIIGWKTRWALVALGLLLCALAFGMIMQQSFGTAANIMVYGIAVTLLLFYSQYDGFGIDRGFSNPDERS